MKLDWLRGRHGAPRRHVRDRDPDRQQHHRGARDAALPAPGPARRTPGSTTSTTWAATFGQTVTEIEVAPTGGGDYRMHTRFAQVPQRPRDAAHVACVRRRQDRRGPQPAHPGALPHQAEDGAERRAPQTVVIPAGPETQAYVAEPADRRRDACAPARRPQRGQHAQGHRRRPPRRARHAAGVRRRTAGCSQGKLERAAHRYRAACGARTAAHLPRLRQRRAVPGAGALADRILRPVDSQLGAMERLRRVPHAARGRGLPSAASDSFTKHATTPRRRGCSPRAAPGMSPS